MDSEGSEKSEIADYAVAEASGINISEVLISSPLSTVRNADV
jgi:hypothetical protein